MIRPGPYLLGCCALLAAAPLWAAPPTPAEMAKSIDKHVEAGWKKANVEPAADASDAEFARRVYLDLIGRIPTVSEVRKFLADKRSDRRSKLVEKLLDSPRFATSPVVTAAARCGSQLPRTGWRAAHPARPQPDAGAQRGPPHVHGRGAR